MFKNKKRSFTIPTSLILERPFDLDVPFSIDECSEYINNIDKGIFSPFAVFLASANQNEVDFAVGKVKSRDQKIWAIGVLQATDETSTQVIGRTGISWDGVRTIGFILLVAIGFFTLTAVIGSPFPTDWIIVWFCMVVLINWWSIERGRKEVLKRIDIRNCRNVTIQEK